MKRLQRPALIFILIVGVCMALWPAGERVYGWWNQRALQAAWQETISASSTAVQSGQRQDKASSRPARVVAVSSMASAVHSSKTTSPTYTKSHKQAVIKPLSKPRAWVPARLSIPDIDLDAIVVQGVGPQMLRKGPGHDPTSVLPGEKGNCVIAAHRNAYGWWFYRLGSLGVDSVIQLQTPQETLTYRVALTRVVREDDLSLLQQTAYPRLTLYTCTLPKSDQRVVVVANLVARRAS
ncbi:MAG TPA: class D sortase [Abditibacteriaceae bacterium]|jgi:sortase A